MARIKMNNMAALKHFIHSKRRAMRRNYELPILSEDEEYEDNDAGDVVRSSENAYQMQHNHLLSCLEQTTVSRPALVCAVYSKKR